MTTATCGNRYRDAVYTHDCDLPAGHDGDHASRTTPDTTWRWANDGAAHPAPAAGATAGRDRTRLLHLLDRLRDGRLLTAERDLLADAVMAAVADQTASGGKARTASDVLVEHDVTRKAMCDALGAGYHLNWQQIIDTAQRSHAANAAWQRGSEQNRLALIEAIELPDGVGWSRIIEAAADLRRAATTATNDAEALRADRELWVRTYGEEIALHAADARRYRAAWHNARRRARETKAEHETHRVAIMHALGKRGGPGTVPQTWDLLIEHTAETHQWATDGALGRTPAAIRAKERATAAEAEAAAYHARTLELSQQLAESETNGHRLLKRAEEAEDRVRALTAQLDAAHRRQHAADSLRWSLDQAHGQPPTLTVTVAEEAQRAARAEIAAADQAREETERDRNRRRRQVANRLGVDTATSWPDLLGEIGSLKYARQQAAGARVRAGHAWAERNRYRQAWQSARRRAAELARRNRNQADNFEVQARLIREAEARATKLGKSRDHWKAKAREIEADRDRLAAQVESSVRAVQGWMAADLDAALGYAHRPGETNGGHKSWSDWWAELVAEVRRRSDIAAEPTTDAPDLTAPVSPREVQPISHPHPLYDVLDAMTGKPISDADARHRIGLYYNAITGAPAARDAIDRAVSSLRAVLG